MEENCENCTHFVKHYIFTSDNYFELIKGHCTFPRSKTRKTTDKACEHFEKKEEPKATAKYEKIFEIEVRIKEKA